MEKSKSRNSGRIIIICVVACVLICAGFFLGRSTVQDTSLPAKESNAALITTVDYGNRVTYVIGHKSPDTDTVMSAIAMANLLNKLGIKAEARVSGKVNGETNYAFERFGITKPEILTDARDAQLWLVDHSEYTQAVSGAEEARIVGITDHHGIGNVSNSEQIFVTSAPAGSTATLVWKLYYDFGIEIDIQTAEALLSGILSDTSYVTTGLTALDQEALADLKKITGISDVTELCAEMQEAKIAYKDMTDTDIFYNDYKEYNENGYSYCIGNVSVKSASDADAMVARMRNVLLTENAASGMDFSAAMIQSADNTCTKVVFAGKDEALITSLTTNAFTGVEGYAGTDENTVVFNTYISRKRILVPNIDAHLENREASHD